MKQLTAIDLFAGAGGFTIGAIQAGIKVLWAANHNKRAVETHAANHPNIIHLCQDLHQANWGLVPRHDILLAGPECKGHTHARGKEQKHHDDSRATAWAVLSCAEYHKPPFIVVENVPGFRNWIFFDLWKEGLSLLGYELTENILNAADFGVPQSRKRLFIVGHKKKIHIKSQQKAHKPAISIIDSEGDWNKIKKPGRAENTIRQIENARKIYGNSFLIAYYGMEKKGRSLDKPLGTVTTRDRFAIIDGKFMRMLTVEEYRRAMGFPASYQLPKTKKHAVEMLGNAVCPPVIKEVMNQIKKAA